MEQLFNFRSRNKNEVAELLSGIDKFLAEVHALGKERSKAVDSMLEEFHNNREKAFKEMKEELKKGRLERNRKVNHFLLQSKSDRVKCQAAWSTLRIAVKAAPEQPVEKPEKPVQEAELAAATPALEEAVPAEVTPDEEELKDHIFAYVNSHTGGIRLTEIETEFNIPRIRAGNLARALVDEGKIGKEGLLYVPIREEGEK
jgi:vacuolar-type H+-ATPase subunit I/STV1